MRTMKCRWLLVVECGRCSESSQTPLSGIDQVDAAPTISIPPKVIKSCKKQPMAEELKDLQS
eukprot:991126-Amphidinium_carterae.1